MIVTTAAVHNHQNKGEHKHAYHKGRLGGWGEHSTTPDIDSLTGCRENMQGIISLCDKAGDGERFYL